MGDYSINNGSLILPKANTEGIMIDPDSADFPWRDITADIVVKGGANAPTWTTFLTNISAYQFDIVGDEVWQVFHIPHDFLVGSEVYIHTHWGLDTADSTNSITWGFDITYAKRAAVGATPEAFQATINKTISYDCSGVPVPQYCHVVSELALTNGSGQVGMTTPKDVEPDGLIMVRTYLSADAGNIDPFLFTVDLHYQSTNVGTKSKDPDFYT